MNQRIRFPKPFKNYKKIKMILLQFYMLSIENFQMTLSKYFNSGQINELPAYAASTCNQTPGNLCNAIPISCKLSNEHDPVVP